MELSIPRAVGYVLGFGARLWRDRQLQAVCVPPAASPGRARPPEVPRGLSCPAAGTAVPRGLQLSGLSPAGLCTLCWGISEMAAAWCRAVWCPLWAAGGPAELIPIVSDPIVIPDHKEPGGSRHRTRAKHRSAAPAFPN